MCQLLNGVQDVQNIFESMHCKYMLMNGNVEKPLKFFVGSCYEGKSPTFSYSMDKRIDKHEIDMIGFENGQPVFCAEFKCTFSYDKNCTKKAVADACIKIDRTFRIRKLKKTTKHIVHFLNHSRQNSTSSLNPEWIKQKSPNTRVVEVEELLDGYKSILGSRIKRGSVVSYPFDCPDVGLEALVINL